MKRLNAGFLPAFAWPLFLLLAAAAILMLSASEPPGATTPVPPQLYSSSFQLLGTGNRLGTYYPAGNALAEWFNSYLQAGNGGGFKAIETNGSVDNVRLLNQKKIMLGMVESRIVKEHCQGNASVSLRIVWPLWQDVVHLLKAPPEKIAVEPFPGAGRNYYGQKNSSTYRTSMEIIEALGLRRPELDFAIAPEDAMQALTDGQIGYATIQAGMPNRSVSDAVIFQNCSLVSLNEEQLASISQMVSTSRRFVIPQGFYGDSQPEVCTVGLPNVLVAGEDVPEQLIELIAELMVKASVNLKVRHQAIADIPSDAALAMSIMKEVGVPMHQGTLNYLKKNLPAADDVSGKD